MPFEPEVIGSQWGKFQGEEGKNEYEIDIIALNEKTNTILFAECKWSSKIDAKKILEDLREKSRFVQWNKDARKEYYAIFAKSFSKKPEERRM